MRSLRYLRDKSRRGVSLLEALMVVLLLSATATATIFQVSNLSVLDPAKQSMHSLVTSLRNARDMATQSQADVVVTLDQTSKPNRWVFDAQPGPYVAASHWELVIEESVRVDGTSAPIRFTPDGSASNFGEWKIQGKEGYYVSLEPIGGKVTMIGLDK